MVSVIGAPKLIQEEYKKRNGKLVGDTEVTSGIRQGCTGSPYLVVMLVNIDSYK